MTEPQGLLAVIFSGVAAAGVVFAALSARSAASQARLAAREAARKTRPWIGLTEVKFANASSAENGAVVTLYYRNVGILPALDVEAPVEIWADPIDTKNDALADEVVEKRFKLGAVFPGEDGDASLEGVSLYYFALQGHTIMFKGSLVYRDAEDAYSTRFEGRIDFPNGPAEPRYTWKHTAAS